jgi:hypothetical protein
MTELERLSAMVEELSAKVRVVEDHVALTQLVARYGPSVDSGSAQATADLWVHDGVFDVVGLLRLHGHDQIAGMVNGEGHQSLIMNGCAHVLTVPHIVIEGDEARGWSYALNIRWDADQERFWVARVSANTWHWRRTVDGWRILERANANLDGSEQPRQMLSGSASAESSG